MDGPRNGLGRRQLKHRTRRLFEPPSGRPAEATIRPLSPTGLVARRHPLVVAWCCETKMSFEKRAQENVR
jgi:hypothetical protein